MTQFRFVPARKFDSASLRPGDVHVWHGSVQRSPEYVNGLVSCLSRDEMQRYQSFRSDDDRVRYAAMRGELRNILSRYLCCKPQQIRFTYNAFGKPFLEAPGRPIWFSLSHSRGRALFAIAQGSEVGIDLEYVDEEFPFAAVARHIFSEEKCSKLRSLKGQLQPAAFFEAWTRLEAYLKAVGTGFSYQREFLRSPKLLSRLCSSSKSKIHNDWTLGSLSVHEGYKAALAINGKLNRVQYFQVFSGHNTVSSS